MTALTITNTGGAATFNFASSGASTTVVPRVPRLREYPMLMLMRDGWLPVVYLEPHTCDAPYYGRSARMVATRVRRVGVFDELADALRAVRRGDTAR